VSAPMRTVNRSCGTRAAFWGRAADNTSFPPADACFFCGRRLSPFCVRCYVAVCAACADPARTTVKRSHPPEAHRPRPAGRRSGPPRKATDEAIREALARLGGNVLAAAADLGISRHCLYRRIESLGFNLSEYRS
jgi:DNA-binding NtrC family response regulator